MTPVPAVSVRFGGRRTNAIVILAIGSAFFVPLIWDRLGWHARGMILAAYGVTALAVILIPALRTRGLLKSGAQAQGSVVGTEEDHTSRGTRYYPVVRFTTADGRTVEFTSGQGYSRDDEAEGTVSVRYRPDDRENAQIDRAVMWVVPAGVGLVGGLGLLVAGVIVYGSGPKAAPQVSAASSPSSEPATAETSAQETPSTPEASSPLNRLPTRCRAQ
jgi:hypothetical protein